MDLEKVSEHVLDGMGDQRTSKGRTRRHHCHSQLSQDNMFIVPRCFSDSFLPTLESPEQSPSFRGGSGGKLVTRTSLNMCDPAKPAPGVRDHLELPPVCYTLYRCQVNHGCTYLRTLSPVYLYLMEILLTSTDFPRWHTSFPYPNFLWLRRWQRLCYNTISDFMLYPRTLSQRENLSSSLIFLMLFVTSWRWQWAFSQVITLNLMVSMNDRNEN